MPRCRDCNERFDDRDDWASHMEGDHGEQLDWCGNCQKPFTDEHALQQHSRIHKQRNQECFGCPRQFESYSAMLIHLESGRCKVSLSDLDIYAVKCYQHKKYVMRDWETLLGHETRETRRPDGYFDYYKQSWECDGCQKTFISEAALNQHRASAVHDPMLFKCPTCEERFSLLSALVQHVESNREETIWTGSSIWKMLNYIHRCVEQA